MFATLLTLALFAAPALNGVSAFQMNTPDLTQCGSARITWEKTKGPYNLIVVDSAEPCGEPLQVADLGDHDGTSITWKVDFASKSKLMFSLEDANGDEAWSGEMTVGNSTDASCLDNAAAFVGSSISGSGSASKATLPTATVAAAGAAVTGGSDDSTPDPLGAASGGSNGASALHMNPVMALCALFAAAALVL